MIEYRRKKENSRERLNYSMGRKRSETKTNLEDQKMSTKDIYKKYFKLRSNKETPASHSKSKNLLLSNDKNA